VIFHSLYSPDTAYSYFHIFGGLKDKIRGAKSETDDIVIRAERTWLREQYNAWKRQDIHTLVPYWQKGLKSGRRLCGKITYGIIHRHYV
jgi:hypothetical protein